MGRKCSYAMQHNSQPARNTGRRVADPQLRLIRLCCQVHHRVRPEQLKNTLKPTYYLSRNMSLEEAANWLKKFEEWFNWNEAINKKEYQTRRVILTKFLGEKILSNLRTDDTFTRETPIRGETINLLRRRFPFDQPLPWKKRPHG